MTATMDRSYVDSLTDDELCALSDDEVDALVAGQDKWTQLNDEAGLYLMTKDYRQYQRRIAGDRAWAQFRMLADMECERPVTAPLNPRRPWARRDAHADKRQGFTRLTLPAPDVSLLVASPVNPFDGSRWED